MIKTEDYLQYASIDEAFSRQPRRSIARICSSFQDEPTVFFLIKGRGDGPAVWIQAALHGDEYDGVMALFYKAGVNRWGTSYWCGSWGRDRCGENRG